MKKIFLKLKKIFTNEYFLLFLCIIIAIITFCIGNCCFNLTEKKTKEDIQLTDYHLDDLNFNVLTGMNFSVKDLVDDEFIIPYNFNSYSDNIDYEYNSDFLLTVNNSNYMYTINSQTIKEIRFSGSNLLLSHNINYLNATFGNSIDLSFNFEIEYLSSIILNEDYTIDLEYGYLTLPYDFFRNGGNTVSIAECLLFCINNNLLNYRWGSGYGIEIYKNGNLINTFYNQYLICANATIKLSISPYNNYTYINSSGLAYDDYIAGLYRGNMRGIYSYISSQLTGGDIQEQFNIGYTLGYNTGYQDGIYGANNYTFLNLIGAVIDAPITAFKGLFNFDFLGFNMLSFVEALLSIMFIVFIIKLIRGD